MSLFTKLFLVFMLLTSFFLMGCTEQSTIPGVPFTLGQFISKTTTTDYNHFTNGDLNGKVLWMDWNRIGFIDVNFGGSTGVGVDTNWETSWVVFDANMKATYALVGSDTNAWTAGIISDLNVFQIDLNTIGNLKADGNLFGNYLTVNSGYICNDVNCYKISDLNISSSGGGLFTNPLTTDLNITKSGAQIVLVNPDTNYYSRLDRNTLNNTLQLRNNSFTQGAPGKAIDCVTGTVNASGTITANTGDFTIAAWIYIPSALNRNGIDIVGVGTQATSTGYAIVYHWLTDTRLSVRVNGTTGGTYGSYVLPSTATWYFVVATRSGTGTNNITGYVNAVPRWNQTNAAAPASSTALKIGNSIGAGGAYTFPGYVDEPLIWNRALTQEEITYLYNTTSGLLGDTSKAPWNNGLIAGYHLDEGAGTTALPMIGANNLTLTSASGWTTGKVTSVAFNSEYPVLKTSDGLNALETSQITLGNYSTQYGSKTIYEGLNHNWNILGTQKMILDASGNVGIGTTTPANKLNVIGDINATTNGYFGGNVGIGANTLLYPLTMIANGGTDGTTQSTIKIIPKSNANNIGLYADGTATWGANAVLQLHAKTSAGALPAIVLRDTEAIGNGASIFIDRTTSPTLPTTIRNDLAIASVSNGNSIIFATKISGTLAERMRIANDGNVGIGTTTPTSKLSVVGDINATGSIQGAHKSSDGTVGYTGTCTSGMTITVKNGLITGCS